MKKKLLSLALALTMCLGLMVVPASAAGVTLTEIVSADTYDSFGAGLNYWPDFSEGIAWIAGRSTGAIDTTGKVIIAPGTYDNGMEFSDGVAWAQRSGKWYLVDKTGKELFALADGLQIELNAGSGSNFHDGLARVRSKETGTYGYIDKTGKVVIPCQYDYRAGNFCNGLAVVYDSANAFYGYIDKTGKVVIPYQYASATDFVNGFAHVQLGNRQTVIDTTGKELISQEYVCKVDWTEDWEDYVGSAEVVLVRQLSGGSYAYVNKAGQIVSGGYESVVMRFTDGMVNVSKDGKGGFVNESGVLAIPCTLSGNRYSFRDGYVAVPNGVGIWNILDKTGKVTGTSQQPSGYGFTNAGNGCFIIQSSKSGRRRYGFVDYTGREIVPCKYAAVKAFSGGVAAVKNFDDKWGFVDTNGNEILPCTLSEVAYTSEPGIFIVTNYHGDGRISLVKSSGWTAPATTSTPSVPAVGGFTDVKTGDYFADPVLWAVEKGITSGTSATTFSPNANCTVAQILTFLWRANGSPKPAGSNPFSDVKSGDYYADAAVWAYEKGMVSGGAFGGNTPCTRSMAVTYMWKAAGSPSARAASFVDVSAGADYASAVAWAVEKGVTSGTSSTTFSPDSICTRGQIVTFLYRGLAK